MNYGWFGWLVLIYFLLLCGIEGKIVKDRRELSYPLVVILSLVVGVLFVVLICLVILWGGSFS